MAAVALRGAPDDAPPDVAEPPTPTPTATEPADPDTDDLPVAPGFDVLAEQVSAVRGLPIRRPVNARLVSEAVLADKITELIDTHVDEVELEHARKLLVALRLLPSDLDLLATLDTLYREQVIGLYVPEEDTLYVRTAGDEMTPFERLTAAHEVVHALQDQSYDLAEMQDLAEEESDRELAIASLIEGDAVLTQQLWSLRYQTDAERQQMAAEAGALRSDAFDSSPAYLQASLLFPYQEGAEFVAALVEQGGLEAIDAALADPPSTTAEILHPDRYLARVAVAEPALPPTPSPDWETQRTYTFGEFDLRQLFAPVFGEATAADLGTGWAGGRVASWERGADTAVTVAFTFDTPSDADAVCARIGDWYAAVAGGTPAGEGLMQGGGDWLAFTCPLPEVRFALAPDEATARALATP